MAKVRRLLRIEQQFVVKSTPIVCSVFANFQMSGETLTDRNEIHNKNTLPICLHMELNFNIIFVKKKINFVVHFVHSTVKIYKCIKHFETVA